MFEYFSKADRGVDLVVRWTTLVTFLSGVLGYLNKNAWYGSLNWSEALLVGFFMALIALLALSATLALFRIFRPLSAGSSMTDATPSELESRVARLQETSLDYGHLSVLESSLADVAKLIPQVEGLEKLQRAIISDYQNMSGREARFTEALDALKESIQRENSIQRANLQALQDRVTESAAASEKKFSTLFIAFQALLAREKVERFRGYIYTEGDFLSERVNARQPVKGQDWRDWQSHYVTFNSAMGHWIDIARDWHPNIEAWIKEPHPLDLTSDEWKGIDELFDGSTPVIAYTTFAIKYRNWKKFEARIGDAIHLGAFGGPNASEILELARQTGSTLQRFGNNG